MPRQGERRSCSLGLAITARFNAMMVAKLVYAAICAAQITRKDHGLLNILATVHIAP